MLQYTVTLAKEKDATIYTSKGNSLHLFRSMCKGALVHIDSLFTKIRQRGVGHGKDMQ